MQSQNTKTIIKKIAYDFEYTEKEVEAMVRAPFNFLVETMRSADKEKMEYPSVRIKYFATFYCSEERKNYFRKLLKKKELVNERAAARDSVTRADIIPIFTDSDG